MNSGGVLGLPFLILYLKWESDSKGQIGFVGLLYMCARVNRTCHVLLDFDLCFSDMDGHYELFVMQEIT